MSFPACEALSQGRSEAGGVGKGGQEEASTETGAIVEAEAGASGHSKARWPCWQHW